MRIGVLTFHRAYNCGAVLQAWALRRVLTEMGHEVDFPDCNSVGNCDDLFHYTKRISRSKRGWRWLLSLMGRLYLDVRFLFGACPQSRHFSRFRKKYLPERHCCVKSFDEYYDVMIVGSDQVWNIPLMGEDTPLFLGESVPPTIPIVAYAASSGDLLMDIRDRKRLTDAVSSFAAVSVREHFAKTQLLEGVCSSAPVVCDPTLLVPYYIFDEFAAPRLFDKPYLYVYTLCLTNFVIRTALALSERLGIELVITPVYPSTRQKGDVRYVYDITPDKMVSYIKHADYVLAASFHGTAMAIVYGKKFLSLREQVDTIESRPASLLKSLGMSERLINPTIPTEELLSRLLKPLPDYMSKLARDVARSKDWLRVSLERLNV